MPFQSEKQRRYMHANLPKIANRWEQKYGLGGIAEQNAQLNQLPEYYLPVAQGGRIGYSQGSGSDYLQYVQAMNALNLQPMPLEIFNSLTPIMSLQDMVNMGSPGKAEGGRIGFAEGPKTYEAWLDYRIKEIAKGNLPVPFERWKKGDIKMNQGGMVPAHQAGILGLAEGGSITKTPEGQTRGFVQSRSDGRRPGYTEDDEDTGGMGHHGGGHGIGATSSSSNQGSDRGHSRFDVGSGYYGETKTTTPSTPDDSDDDDKAASYENWNIQEKYTGDEDLEEQQEIDRRNAITRLKYDPNLSKNDRHALEVGLGLRQPKQNTLMGNIVKGIITIATAGAGAGVFGKDAMKVAKLYQKFNQAKQIKTAWDDEKIKLGKMEFDISNLKNKLTSDNQKLIASLPEGHPERIALEAKMKIKTPPTDDKDGAGSIKIEEIETVNKTKAQKAKDEEYLKMQKVAYLHYLEQQKTRQAYLDNFRQMFLANKGGLAGLFRVKNS